MLESGVDEERSNGRLKDIYLHLRRIVEIRRDSVVQALLLNCGRGKDLSWWDGEGDDGDAFVDTGGSADVGMALNGLSTQQSAFWSSAIVFGRR